MCYRQIDMKLLPSFRVPASALTLLALALAVAFVAAYPTAAHAATRSCSSVSKTGAGESRFRVDRIKISGGSCKTPVSKLKNGEFYMAMEFVPSAMSLVLGDGMRCKTTRWPMKAIGWRCRSSQQSLTFRLNDVTPSSPKEMLLPSAVPASYSGANYGVSLGSAPELKVVTRAKLPFSWRRAGPASYLKPFLEGVDREGSYEPREVGDRTVYFWAEHNQGAAWQEGPFTYIIIDKFTTGEGEQAISSMTQMIASAQVQRLSTSWRPLESFPDPAPGPETPSPDPGDDSEDDY